MTSRQSDEDGALRRPGMANYASNNQNTSRGLPERSRTLSNSELHNEKNAAGLQYATTNPTASSVDHSNKPSSYKSTAFTVSRSEDGHTSSKGPSSTGFEGPPLPTPSAQQTLCASCGHIVAGQFVRALGVVFHKSCFTCNVRYGGQTVSFSSLLIYNRIVIQPLHRSFSP
jgi:hypothetical protein